MKSFIVRNAELQDIESLVRLLEQLFSIEKDFEFNPETHRMGLRLMLEGCNRHRTVKVAVCNDKIVGMCTAQTRISTARGSITAVLEDLVVDADYRHQGIGQGLLSEISQWAQKRGIGHLQLLADKDNSPALTFYKHNEWQETNLVCLTRSV
ncbi:MAG: GNAT family N-acetyltransferase [Desulfobacterales bacterium RIFOXYA12_FULL_46_15]|nr:MAG: GNAT family N-acetyltransferase [Desulfobacula sp. GWF2_41_7]OGR23270.1 MAG: GNAT family N-acetyltransferase [Desulfobacterales bacterium RIFOXYA12_FULL_46_15]